MFGLRIDLLLAINFNRISARWQRTSIQLSAALIQLLCDGIVKMEIICQ